VRAFVALDLPDALTEACLRLQEAVPLGRATPVDNLHLTLAFLGDVEPSVLEEVHRELDGRRLPRCPLLPAGLSCVGGRGPKLLALEMAAEPGLRAVQAEVARAVRAAGITLPRTRFRPHVTLIRFGNGLPPHRLPALDRALRELGQPDIPETVALQATLYGSTLTPDGAVHEALAAYPLA
jgi:2'-5' RNA ligase